MKTFWLGRIALALGLVSAPTAWAQYPNYNQTQFQPNPYNQNVGPSSFPVQQWQPGMQVGVPPAMQPRQFQLPPVAYPQGIAQPQHGMSQPQQVTVPTQPGGFQLTNWQENVPSVPVDGQFNAPSAAPALGMSPSPTGQPLPIAPQIAPHNGGYAPAYSAPPVPAQFQAVAPGCTSCGNAPVSQGYAAQPGQYAFTAPGVSFDGGFGGDCSTGFCGAPYGRRGFAGGLPVGANPFFFGASALIFRRVDDYNRVLSIYDATGNTALSTRDAAMGTMGGFEVLGGRYFNCGRNAIALSYWGLFPDNEMVAVTDLAGGLRSRVFRPRLGPANNTGELQLPTGPAPDVVNNPDIYDVYDTALTHRLRRSSQFQNIEINLLGFAAGGAARNFNRATAGAIFPGHRGQFGAGCGGYGFGGAGCGGCGDCYSDCGGFGGCGGAPRFATGPCGYTAPGCGSRLNVSWLAGVRYFQFRDNLEYAAIGGPMIPVGDALSYDIAVRNHLVGFQVGGRTDFCLGNNFNLYGLGKVGIFGNHSSMDARIGTSMFTAYRSNDPTMPFMLSRSNNDVAFISELGTGAGWRFSPRWSATVGYRAIVASGVATAVGNIRNQGDGVDATRINSQDYLILHGIDIGALYNF